MSFNVFEGVVESRSDPLNLGRCKVRVIGVHTEDTTLLPTKDLPWANPMQPITSAGVSGIGESPTGVVEGTWVYVFFADGDNKQQPIMMGVIAGIPESNKQSLSDSQKSISGTAYSSVSDSQSKSSGTNSSSSASSSKSGEQVLTQDTSSNGSNEETKNGEYKLGQISKKYESGNSGVGTVSSGTGDLGGVSYGSHQLASFRDNTGAAKSASATNSPVQTFVNSSKWKSDFNGLIPGTAAYTAKWKQIASSQGSEFESAQYEYFKSQYYSKGLNNVKSAGIDVTSRGNAVQECIWSTSVQYGTGGVRKIFVRCLDGKDIGSMSDADICNAVQDSKKNNITTDFKSSSASVQSGIRNRVEAERKDLIALAGNDGVKNKKPDEEKKEESTEVKKDEAKDYSEDSEYTAPSNPTPVSGVNVPTMPDSTGGTSGGGFCDQTGNYPKSDWLGEADVSRLARNKNTNKTIVSTKRNSLVKNVQTAGGSNWSEPESKYAAIYPLNHVRQTESGHVVEYDDTPNKERIHVYHRAGSFIEWHPDGSIVYKSTKDEYEVTVKDRNVYVGGNCNITVLGNTNIYSKGVLRMESDGDMFIKTKSNMRIGAVGTMHIESNGDMFCGSSSNYHEAGSNIFMNCGWNASHVLAGGYNAGEIAVEVMQDSTAVVPENIESEVINQLKKDGEITPKEALPSKNNSNGTETAEDPKKEEPVKNEDTPACEGCCEFTETQVVSSLKLSTNFSLSDLTTSCHYPHAICEQGGKSKLEIAKSLCNVANNVLEKVVTKYGRSSFIITSGFRRGSGTSQHLKGEAVDIQFPGLSWDKIPARAEELSSHIGTYDQMILEWHGNNPVIHISYGGSMRKQKLSTPNLKNYFSGFRYKDMSSPK